MSLFVYLLAIVVDSCLQLGLKLLCALLLLLFFVPFSLELALDMLILFDVQRVDISTPLPVQVSLAVGLRLVEDTAGTDLLVDDGYGLKSV